MIKGNISRKNRSKYYFSLIAACLFIFFGALQILVTIGFIEGMGNMLNIPNDIIGSMILLLLGTIFLYAVFELRSGIRVGVAYTYVGIILSIFFMGIYLLIIIVTSIEIIISSGTTAVTNDIVTEIKPIIYLGLISLFGFIKWRSKFSIE